MHMAQLSGALREVRAGADRRIRQALLGRQGARLRTPEGDGTRVQRRDRARPAARRRRDSPSARSASAASCTASCSRARTGASGCRRNRQASAAARRSRRCCSGAQPCSCASASTSLKPFWCGLILRAPQAGTSSSRSTLQCCRARARSRSRRTPARTGWFRRRGAGTGRACRRPSARRRRETGYAWCSASTALTPKPSSAQRKLPMPSTSTSR